MVETEIVPWLASEAVGPDVRVSWLRHSDAFRDGGRAGAHRGPCRDDAAHLILWHLCTGVVDMKAYGEGETAEFYPRWIPTMEPGLRVWRADRTGLLWVETGDGRPLRWSKCCGLSGRILDGMWITA